MPLTNPHGYFLSTITANNYSLGVAYVPQLNLPVASPYTEVGTCNSLIVCLIAPAMHLIHTCNSHS